MPPPSGRPAEPGIYVGAWRIISVLGLPLAGARHLAICVVNQSGGTATVWELIGPLEYARNHIEPAGRPHYADWAGYTWVRVAELSAYTRLVSAIAQARAEFVGWVYTIADSNRFVGRALAKAGIAVSPAQRAQLGWAPAFDEGLQGRGIPGQGPMVYPNMSPGG